MKVRWTSRSIRLRITPDELAQIEHHEEVQDSLPLLGWSVQIQPSDSETSLLAAGPALIICLSPRDVALLAEPEREGVYFDHPGAPPLRYFIEKDFPCVHPRALEALETPTETFAEPEGFRERKGVDSAEATATHNSVE